MKIDKIVNTYYTFTIFHESLYLISLSGHKSMDKAISGSSLSRPVLILGAVQLIETLAFALPISFFPNYVIKLGASVSFLNIKVTESLRYPKISMAKTSTVNIP